MIAAIVVSFVVGLIVNEFCAFSPWCAGKLVRWSAFRQYADRDRAEMRAEELTRLINDRPGNMFKVITAACFAISAVIVSARRAGAREADAIMSPRTAEAGGRWGELQRRWVAELAATLADGDPCPVCGSLDHPELYKPLRQPEAEGHGGELQRRWVAELAATLADGDPCPACGSLDHPELYQPLREAPPASR